MSKTSYTAYEYQKLEKSKKMGWAKYYSLMDECNKTAVMTIKLVGRKDNGELKPKPSFMDDDFYEHVKLLNKQNSCKDCNVLFEKGQKTGWDKGQHKHMNCLKNTIFKCGRCLKLFNEKSKIVQGPQYKDYHEECLKQPEKRQCLICLEPTDDFSIEITSCNHVYHETCLTQWRLIKNECPTCKRKLVKENF